MTDDESTQGTPLAPSAAGARSEGAPGGELCALDGCDLPLPVRALDEQGRPKGGRRPRYCSKAHADAASRQRRARDVAAVDDPLSLARAVGEAFLPGARALAAQLGELIARFDEAEAGALARVRAAEQEAVAAAAEASAAREAGEVAEQARRQALAQARADRQARDNAIKEAERSRREAEEVRSAAWEQVAVHERSRGQAEAARVAAQASADGLVGQNRQLREQLELARAASAELTAQVAVAGREQERGAGENRALLARVEAVERVSRQDGDRWRDQVAAVQARLGEVQAEAAVARSTGLAQVAQADRVREELAEARRRASGLQAELAAERSAAERDRQQLAEARRELGAGVRRRRKADAAVRAARRP